LSINKRLFSIKKLFYLSFQVKLQFFKTFILPYFDYCSTLFIYFNKTTIQKIANSYYYCLSRLLKFKFTAKYINNNFDFNHLNNELEKLNLQSFQHRILSRLLIFAHKVANHPDSPTNLSKHLSYIQCNNHSYDLRNYHSSVQLFVPPISYLNNFGSKTFQYNFPKLLNQTCVLDLNLPSKLFKNRVFNNINNYFNKFVESFKNFELNYVSAFI